MWHTVDTFLAPGPTNSALFLDGSDILRHVPQNYIEILTWSWWCTWMYERSKHSSNMCGVCHFVGVAEHALTSLVPLSRTIQSVGYEEIETIDNTLFWDIQWVVHYIPSIQQRLHLSPIYMCILWQIASSFELDHAQYWFSSLPSLMTLSVLRHESNLFLMILIITKKPAWEEYYNSTTDKMVRVFLYDIVLWCTPRPTKVHLSFDITWSISELCDERRESSKGESNQPLWRCALSNVWRSHSRVVKVSTELFYPDSPYQTRDWMVPWPILYV